MDAPTVVLAGGLVTVTLDGDQYCALYGKDLQEGVAGFGKTQIDALDELFKALGQDVRGRSDVRWLSTCELEVYLGGGIWTSLARAIIRYEVDKCEGEDTVSVVAAGAEVFSLKTRIKELESIIAPDWTLAERISQEVLDVLGLPKGTGRTPAELVKERVTALDAEIVVWKKRYESEKEDLDSVREHTERAMEGQCGYPDEVHCTCRPTLLRAIEALTAKLAAAMGVLDSIQKHTNRPSCLAPTALAWIERRASEALADITPASKRLWAIEKAAEDFERMVARGGWDALTKCDPPDKPEQRVVAKAAELVVLLKAVGMEKGD